MLQAAAARGELAPEAADAEFDAMTERVQRADDTYAIAAHFHAHLLERRAQAERTPEAYATAEKAYRRAMLLDPFVSDIFSRLGRSQTLHVP